MKATDVQVGGNHYKQFKIQPIEFCMKNGLNACQTNIVKYICRYKDKNGKEDLLKALHYVGLLEQFIKDGIKCRHTQGEILVQEFCNQNQLTDSQYNVLYFACFLNIENAKYEIEQLIKNEYPDAD